MIQWLSKIDLKKDSGQRDNFAICRTNIGFGLYFGHKDPEEVRVEEVILLYSTDLYRVLSILLGTAAASDISEPFENIEEGEMIQ